MAVAKPRAKPRSAKRAKRGALEPAGATATPLDADGACDATATAAAPPGAALAAANAAVQEQWRHDVRFAPELTPRQASVLHHRLTGHFTCPNML